jgi:hypothetical protein
LIVKRQFRHPVAADIFAQGGRNVNAPLLKGTREIEKALACRRHAVHINRECVGRSKMVKWRL